MTCREFTEFLATYLEGALPAEQRTLFEAHIEGCAACVRYLRSYRETMRLGRGAFTPDEPVPDEVPEELVQAILAARRKH
jgi:anti-sigma factor RsiW